MPLAQNSSDRTPTRRDRTPAPADRTLASHARHHRLCVGFLLGLVAFGLLFGCAGAVPATRTLPSYVKRIYIPEFRNRSREFGAQADLTLKVNDAFMEDGRLDVVQNERADLRLEGVINEFRETPHRPLKRPLPTGRNDGNACHA